MNNNTFLSEILMSEAEYWVVARETTAVVYGRMEKQPDQIIFIAIPFNVRRGLKYEEITLKEIDDLNRSNADQNIFLNEEYAPFQHGISFYGIYRGFPVTRDYKKFIVDALTLDSNDIWAYEDLIKQYQVLNELTK